MLQFLNPGLLAGALLFAVPLIIHLLNRQRHKRRPWAAMEFLLAAYRKQRRRLRRENLLLLLLRCAIPIALALAIARPLLKEDADLGAGGSGNAHHVLVIDASYSMGLEQSGATTPFERAKLLAGSLLDRIGAREGQPRVTLFVQGVRPTVPFREEIDVERAKARIAALGTALDVASPVSESLAQVADFVEELQDPEIRVHLFTDLQVRSFGDDPFGGGPGGAVPPGTEPPAVPAVPAAPTDPTTGGPTAAMFADTAADAIHRIRAKAELNVFDVRGRSDGGTEDNLQLVELRLGPAHAIQRVELPILATVRNRTETARSVQVMLEIDGGQPLRKSVQVEAGAEAEVEFTTAFREPGQHRLRATLGNDALAADDARQLVVDVRDRVRVLVVEGSAETDPALRTSTHLVEVLDPTGGEGAPELTQFAPTVVEPVAFLSGRARPADFDLVVLADVPRLDRATADALSAAVRTGTGLFVMFGPNADPTSYTEFLQRGGTGPMPIAIGSAEGFAPGGERYFGSLVERPNHPVFRDFTEDVYVEILESVPVWRFVGAERPAEPTDDRAAPPAADPDAADNDVLGPRDTEVLMSVRDAARSPLLIASRFGAGKTLFMTTPITRAPDRWNRLDAPVAGLSFLLLWPAAEWLTVPATDSHNVPVGSALSAILRERPSNLFVVPPESSGAGKVPLGEEAAPLLGDRYALPAFRRTDRAGFYEFEMLLGDDAGNGRRHTESFAVNPDPVEGELTYLSHEAAKERLGVPTILTDLPTAANPSIDAGTDELGPWFLMMTLAFLIGEAGLARWVARRRA